MKWTPVGYAAFPPGPPPGPPLAPMPRGTTKAAQAADTTSTTAQAEDKTSYLTYSAEWQPLLSAKASADGGGLTTWECPDLFLLPSASRVDRSSSPLWVLKASGGLTPASKAHGVDFWSTGTFHETNGSFVHGANSLALPSDLQRVDFGDFYASKTFFDPVSMERVIFGWVMEEAGAPLLDWRSMQSTPRTIREDPLFPNRLVFSPVDAMLSLRAIPPVAALRNVTLAPYSFSPQLPLGVPHLDLTLTFQPPFATGATFGVAVEHGGLANATITVLADDACGASVPLKAIPTQCANLTVGAHHGPFKFARDQPLDLRVLVDASIIEAFAAGGRAAVTARGYEIGPSLRVGLLNDGHEALQLLSMEAFAMHKAVGLELDDLRSRAHE